MPVQKRVPFAGRNRPPPRQNQKTETAQPEILKSLKTELADVRKRSDYLEQERDKMQQFWEITKGQLASERSQSLETQRSLEGAKTAHLAQVLDLSHKIKSLMIAGNMPKKLVEVQTDEVGPSTSNNGARATIATQTKSHESVSHILEAKPVLSENEAEGIRGLSESQVDEIMAQMTSQHNAQIKKLAAEKASQFQEIVNHHMQELHELRDSYEELLTVERVKIGKYQEQLSQNQEENQQLFGHLEAAKGAQEALLTLNREQSQKLDQANLYAGKAENLEKTNRRLQTDLRVTKKELNQMQEKYEFLKKTLNSVQTERDRLYEEFTKAIGLVHQKTETRDASLIALLSNAEKMLLEKQ